MTFSPPKSTIFVPKNLRKDPKICVDCGSPDAVYYSYAYKVYLCGECANIHDTHLGKYDLDNQLRYHCPPFVTEEGRDENYYFNQEFEAFLPEFFQKMGARTPENFRREYIISKYTHKVFSTQSGLDCLVPDLITTMILKRCKQRSTWHPCCVRLNREDRTLQYYSYKSNRLDPKLVIPLREVDLFVEPLTEGTYLHLIWTQNIPKMNQKKSFLRRKVSTCSLDQNSQRSFFFRASTDFELLQLYFSICRARPAPSAPPVPVSRTLKHSYSFDLILSRVGEEDEMCSPFLPTRKSACDFLDFKRDPLIDLFRSPRVEKNSRTLPDRLALSGSYCLDTRGRDSFSSCHSNGSPVSQEEVVSNFRTDKLDYVIDSEFHSCHPGEQTNPFLPPNLFQDNLDRCPIFDTSPLATHSPVWTPPPTAICPLELDGGVDDGHFYHSIRQDIAGNKKLYQLSGWLFKAGEMAGDMWRYRWFNISNTHVTYSENQFSPFPKNEFHLDSDTRGFRVDTLPSVLNLIPPPNPHFFRILTPHRVYHLCAPSEEDKTAWMEVISRVIALSFVLK